VEYCRVTTEYWVTIRRPSEEGWGGWTISELFKWTIAEFCQKKKKNRHSPSTGTRSRDCLNRADEVKLSPKGRHWFKRRFWILSEAFNAEFESLLVHVLQPITCRFPGRPAEPCQVPRSHLTEPVALSFVKILFSHTLYVKFYALQVTLDTKWVRRVSRWSDRTSWNIHAMGVGSPIPRRV